MMVLEVLSRGHFPTTRHSTGLCRVVAPDRVGRGPRQEVVLDETDIMRRLKDYEEIGLIGYPRDGQYIAAAGNDGHLEWLVGGELCGLDGAAVADQANSLQRHYPHRDRLVLATVKDGWVLDVKDYDAPLTSEQLW